MATASPFRRPLALIVGVTAAMSLALLGDQLLYVVLPGRPEVAGIGVASLGIILGVNRFVRLGANGLSGALSDRLGRRWPFLLGMALALLSTAGYLVSTGFWPLLAARLAWGVAFALISVGGLSITLDLAAVEERGRTVGTYLSLVQLGTLLGLVLSGLLVDRAGYRATLAVYVPLTALGCVIAWVTLRGPVLPHRGGGAGAAARAGRGRLVLDRRLAAPAYASLVSHFAGSGILMATLGMALRQDAGGTATVTGLLLASRRLVGMIMAPLAGHLSDRLGSRRPVAVAGTVGLAAGFLVLVLGPRGLETVVTGVGLTALGEGVLHPALAAWVGDATPEHRRGVMMGVLATVNDLGAAVGPLAGYALAAAVDLGAAYGLCAGLVATGTLALLAAPARGRPGAPRPGREAGGRAGPRRGA